MSESTTTSAVVNATSPAPTAEPQLPTSAATAAPTPEQNPSPQGTAPAVDTATAQQAAEQAAAREQEARDLADATRAAAVKAYRKGESAYAAGLLESGRLCGVYVGQRLALGDKREVAVKALEGDLSRYSSTEVDVNRLIRTFHAYRLLALETGLTEKPAKGKPAPADSVAYGVYRDHYARLVERVASGREESYALLPGIEAACRSMFRRAVRDELSPKAAGELVGKLVRAHAARLARAEKARLATAEAKARAEREAEQRAVAELRAAQAAERAAQEQAKGQQDAAAAVAVREAQDALAAKQRQLVKQQAKAEQAERERQRAERAAREQAERERKAAEKAAAKAQQREQQATKNTGAGAGDPSTASTREEQSRAPKGPSGAQTKGEAVTGNLLRSAAAGSAKDVGSMAAEFLLECEGPDDALEAMLQALTASGDLSAKAKRACKAALVILAREEKPTGTSPVEIANQLARVSAPAPAEQLNGEPAAA
jgi:hypothetical protein